jgi:hypothetical protein
MKTSVGSLINDYREKGLAFEPFSFENHGSTFIGPTHAMRRALTGRPEAGLFGDTNANH